MGMAMENGRVRGHDEPKQTALMVGARPPKGPIVHPALEGLPELFKLPF